MAAARTADTNLLFGVLAFQNGFITRDQLVAGTQACAADKTLRLDQHLLKAGVLSPELHQLLQPLVAAHLRQHNDDPQRSLAAICSSAEIKRDLAGIVDSDRQDSLQALRSEPSGNADVTLDLGIPSSDGGRFQILRHHARGGLGEVFVARDKELGREVALKEIQAAKDDPESRARFTREAEITGGLEHPGIVPVYGLGSHPDGRPFYAMRFIRGTSLHEAIRAFHRTPTQSQDTKTNHAGTKVVRRRGAKRATEQNLELRRLLQRFIDVCEAVDYAHSRGVLHRDLKPGNIMLGRYGEALVVDWGLAKAAGLPDDAAGTGQSLSVEAKLRPRSGESSATMVGAAIGTPAYMPPEQAEGRLDLVSPASDVYSLGATLYSILTGQTPVQGKDMLEVLESVRYGRIVPPRNLNNSVARPLEAICLKAMALEPSDRYGSAKALADDIEHWLADEPVVAFPEALPSRLRRRLRKRPGLVGSVFASLAVGLLAVGAGSIVLGQKNQALSQANRDLQIARDDALDQKQEAERQEKVAVAQRQEAETQKLRATDFAERAIEHKKKAQEEQERVKKSMEFLVAAFRKPDPYLNGRDLKASDLLLTAAREAQVSLVDEPLLQAELLSAIWLTVNALGLEEEQLPLAAKAAELYANVLGPDNPDTLLAMCNLAHAHGRLYQYEKAGPIAEETLKRSQQALGTEHDVTLQAMHTLARHYRQVGQEEKSVLVLEELLAKTQQKLGPDHAQTLDTMEGLADAYHRAFQFDKATPLLEAALGKQRQKLGRNHIDTIQTTRSLAATYRASGQWQKSLPLAEEAFTRIQGKMGPDHETCLEAMDTLAKVYMDAGQSDKALPLWEAYSDLCLKTHPPRSMNRGLSLRYPANGLYRAKAWASAELAARESLEIYQIHEPQFHPVFAARSLLGEILAGHGAELCATDKAAASSRFAEAEPLMLSGIKGRLKRLHPIPPRFKGDLALSIQRLIDLYQAWEKPTEAETWQKKLQELQTSGAITTERSTDSHRRAAERILSQGGTVGIFNDLFSGNAAKVTDLPAEPFALLSVNLNERDKLTAEDLQALAQVKYVGWLGLRKTNLSDDGLELLRNMDIGSIDLIHNSISDDGMRRLGSRPDLFSLLLTGERITDVTATQLRQFSALRHLALAGTTISETGLAEIGRIPALHSFTFGWTSNLTLKGLASLQSCPSLQVLILGHSNLDDSYIDVLANFSQLRHVDLRDTKVSDEAAQRLQQALPRALVRHPGIAPHEAEKEALRWLLAAGATVLDPEGRPFQEITQQDLTIRRVTLPEAGPRLGIEHLRNLRTIGSLHWSNLKNADSEVAHLESLDSLVELVLIQSDLTAAGMQRLTALTELETLRLDGSKGISDQACQHLPAFKHLGALAVNTCPIGDAGLAAIGQIKSLRYLSLTHCPEVKPEGLNHLANLPILRELYLDRVAIDDAAVPHLAKLTSLRVLKVSETRLSANGVKQLQEALPQCAIIWDDRVELPEGGRK